MQPAVKKLSISLLGPFQVALDGIPLQGFRTAKVRALLAYLSVESHRPWPRSILGDLLWPDLPEVDAQSNLRNAISNLRKVIGDRRNDPPFLLVFQEALQFNLQAVAWLDVQIFIDLVASARRAGGEACTPQDLAALESALGLYRGDFMEGFSIASAPFEEWVLLKSGHIQHQLREALRLLVTGYQARAALDQSLQYARRWLELEPWDEAAHRHVMQIYAQKGQRSAALNQFEICRQRLETDLGVEPEPETIWLYDQIRTGQAAPAAQPPGAFVLSSEQMPDFLKDAQPSQSETPVFVARQKELERLDGELEKTVHGQGRIFFITGDPGSGKTALLGEFARRSMLRIPGLVVAWGQCNAYTGEASPYFPFLEIMQTLSGDVEARLAAGAISAEHARRLWGLLPEVIHTVLEQGPDLLNSFLSGNDLLAAAQMHRGVRRELLARLQTLVERTAQESPRPRLRQATMFSQFVKVLSSLSQRRPLVLILDDLQWIDADSVNLLFHLARRVSGSRILLLGAYRSEDVALGRQGQRHPLEGLVHELQTSLGDIRLDLMQDDGLAFVQGLLDSEPNRLGPDFRRLLHRHTSGHPLFTIELLRGMQLRGDLVRNRRNEWVQGANLNWDELPVRVEAVIAERIGHLPQDARDMLSIASVEGEQFTAEVLARIQGKEPQQVIGVLSRDLSKIYRLVAAQSRKQIRSQALSLYRFRHFLYQKYLYQQLDPVEKARLHEKVGASLEEFYQPDLVKSPEVAHQLARHFDLAGLPGKAVRYYTEAGKNAIQLVANREAVAHFERALDLLQALPESEQCDRQALSLYLSLGPPLTATLGWAAPQLEQNYRRVEELCEKMADNALLVPALWLSAVYRLGRSEHEIVNRLVERLTVLAEKTGNPGLLCLADLNVVPLHQGRLIQARQILTRVSQWRDLDLQSSLAIQYGMSPAVVGLAYLGNCLWLMGFEDQAAQCSQEAIEFAEALNVPLTRCYALARSCWQLAFGGEIEAVRPLTRELHQVARQHEFRNFELAAVFFHHWANALTGHATTRRIHQMHQAMEAYQSLGTVLNSSTFLILFAQACAEAGQIERGLAALDEAIAFGEKTGERWFEAEAWRLKGELLAQLAVDAPQPAAVYNQAEDCLEAAGRIASQQSAGMIERRSAASLERLRKAKAAYTSIDHSV
jgi:DNA-binding SARP family transcriptional activator/tetratricopeptide (TPR) repeat protein